jgi:hypothetical protein
MPIYMAPKLPVLLPATSFLPRESLLVKFFHDSSAILSAAYLGNA